MLAPRMTKNEHISDDSKLDHVVQKLWEVETGGQIRQTLMTAVGSDSALWTTWTITLPKLMLTPPISVQSFSVSFTGDACSSQLQKTGSKHQQAPQLTLNSKIVTSGKMQLIINIMGPIKWYTRHTLQHRTLA
jgi:hypothetical protein